MARNPIRYLDRITQETACSEEILLDYLEETLGAPRDLLARWRAGGRSSRHILRDLSEVLDVPVATLDDRAVATRGDVARSASRVLLGTAERGPWRRAGACALCRRSFRIGTSRHCLACLLSEAKP